MREIKFRVWNKEWKMFAVAITDIYFDIETHLPYGIEFEHQTTDGQWHCDSWMENCEFQQFTGLQDKNGKDIYEGDIVRTWSGVEHMGAWEFSDLFEVKWDFKLLMELSMWDYVEVIGNIYENPELLTN